MKAHQSTVRVTKLEAAGRQLETSIKLYFQYGDPVSIHSLGLAAYGVIHALNKKRIASLGAPPDPNELMFLDLDRFLDSKADKKRFRDGVAAAQNFFKHGNSDAKTSFTLDTRLTEGLLLDAVQKYALLAGAFPPTMALYFLWYVTQYPHAIDRVEMPDSLRKDIERSRRAVTKNRERFRAEHLQAAKAIAKAFSVK